MKRMWSKNELNRIIATLLASGSLPEIKGDEIIENMEGYSFAAITVTGYTFDYIYAGAVKNGNKLTLVLCLNITKDENADNPNPYIGKFTVPSDILAKLYPVEIGGNPVLDTQMVKAYKGIADGTTMESWLEKSSVDLPLQVNTSNLTLDVSYFYRYEVTFLLSDNLIPQP